MCSVSGTCFQLHLQIRRSSYLGSASLAVAYKTSRAYGCHFGLSFQIISVLCVGERLVWGLLTSYVWNLIPTVGNTYRGHLFKLVVSGGHSHCKWIFTHKLCDIILSSHWRPQVCRNHGTWKQDDFSFELVPVQLPGAGTSASSVCVTIYHSCSNEGWGNSTLQEAVVHPFLGNSCFKEEVGSPEGNWPFRSHKGGLIAPYFVNHNDGRGHGAMLLG